MNFAEAVAKRADVDVKRVRRVLDDYDIEAQPTRPSPVSLTLTRVRFAGTKQREGRPDEGFEFDRELGPGLWAVTSRKHNFMGKSSVLFVIRWALTGRSHLTDDVRAWIEEVEVSGTVGAEDFRVAFDSRNGGVKGTLTSQGSETEFTAQTFEETMSAFFLDRLRLEPTPFWSKRPEGEQDEGDRALLGWTGYFPALHLPGTNLSVLLGDQVMGGQAGRLMQVFLGLPWSLTYAAADVAERRAGMAESAQRRREAADEKARAKQAEPLRRELKKAESELKGLQADDKVVSAARADELSRELAEALAAHREAVTALSDAEGAHLLIRADLQEAQKRLDALRQTHFIRPLLGRLTPTECPRCATVIDAARVKEEAEGHACSVCTTDTHLPDEDETEVQGAEEAVAALDQAEGGAKSKVASAKAERAEAQTALDRAKAALRKAEAAAPKREQVHRLETKIARLEGQLAQPQAVLTARPDVTDRPILVEAKSEAQTRRQDASGELLEELGSNIAELGRAFGMENLEAARPDLGARLSLVVAKAKSTFSKREPGERLRLRLATVIALLQIGLKQGVGRHPGLLLIDSPGGEEMVDSDLAAVLGALSDVCDQMPDLQLICASARADEVRGVVSAERIIHGPDDAEVW